MVHFFIENTYIDHDAECDKSQFGCSCFWEFILEQI